MLLAMPVLAFPLILTKNYYFKKKHNSLTVQKPKKLVLDQIEALISNKSTSKKDLEHSVEVFAAKFSQLSRDKNPKNTKEKFAHRVVMLNYLAQHPNSFNGLVEQLGNALIKQNPAFRNEFEKKVNSALKMKRDNAYMVY